MRLSVLSSWVAFGFAATATTACADVTHDEQVQALGGEAPGVGPGPNHRPGQPCLVCHGEAGPASGLFSVAGTVFAVRGQKAPAVGAQVMIEDLSGNPFTLKTNAAGNFYATPAEWSPMFPAQVVVTQGQNVQAMQGKIGRDGSCGACHTPLLGPTSPGEIYVASAPAASPEGGP